MILWRGDIYRDLNASKNQMGEHWGKNFSELLVWRALDESSFGVFAKQTHKQTNADVATKKWGRGRLEKGFATKEVGFIGRLLESLSLDRSCDQRQSYAPKQMGKGSRMSLPNLHSHTKK